jgi:hypothetical protein
VQARNLVLAVCSVFTQIKASFKRLLKPASVLFLFLDADGLVGEDLLVKECFLFFLGEKAPLYRILL